MDLTKKQNSLFVCKILEEIGFELLKKNQGNIALCFKCSGAPFVEIRLVHYKKISPVISMCFFCNEKKCCNSFTVGKPFYERFDDRCMINFDHKREEASFVFQNLIDNWNETQNRRNNLMKG